MLTLVMSLPSENLEIFECEVLKHYNGLETIITVYCGEELYPYKIMKKHKILN
jgi:hypothetical protein